MIAALIFPFWLCVILLIGALTAWTIILYLPYWVLYMISALVVGGVIVVLFRARFYGYVYIAGFAGALYLISLWLTWFTLYINGITKVLLGGLG